MSLRLEDLQGIAQKSGVIQVIDGDKNLLEPFGNLMDKAFFPSRSDLNLSWDLLVKRENDKVNCKLVKMRYGPEQDEDNQNSTLHRNLWKSLQTNFVFSDSDIGENPNLLILNRNKFLSLCRTGQYLI